jgi:hypothetical protein
VVDNGPPPAPAAGVSRLPFLVDDYFIPNGCFSETASLSATDALDGLV